MNDEMKESYLIQEKLRALGSVAPLNITFDKAKVDEQLSDSEDRWVFYNKSKKQYNRYGISLFSLDGSTSGEIDLNSIYEYNQANSTSYDEMSFRTPTEYWHTFTSISEPLKLFEPYLGRSHILRLDEGGFFPPHRDWNSAFRLVAFFDCEPWEMVLLMDDQKINYQPYRLYYMDTMKAHSLFSFKKNSNILVLNLEPTWNSYETVVSNLREF